MATIYRCPDTWHMTPPAQGPLYVVGCGHVFEAEPDREGLIDCPNCGMWFGKDNLKALTDAILTLAKKHDPNACWNSDEPDENCLLVDPSAVVFLLDRYPEAYEDPNEPPFTTDHTRVVFPTLPLPEGDE